jgi:subtilisin family serine protease
LCDPKLQNWRWADSLEINIEETVSQMTQQSKREGTGWSAQLNYIVNSFDPVVRQEKKDTIPEKTESPLQKGKIIAILDSGLDLFYAAKGRITLYSETSDGCAPSGSQGWNFVDDNNNIEDNNGHGTSVAGAIVEGLMKAASSGEYTCGAQFLILKTLDANGVGNIFDAMCAVQYAVKAEAEIINMSWGFYNADNEFFRDSILTLSFRDDAHPVFVASMGNLGLNNADTTMHYPSAYGFSGEMRYILGVGSDRRNEIWGSVADVQATPSKLALFSNFDTSDVMVTAPGEKIRTWAKLDGGLARYHLVSGTSYSAALVTAAVAVTQCCDPAATAVKVEDRLRGSGPREMNTVAGLNVTLRNVVMESDSLCNR